MLKFNILLVALIVSTTISVGEAGPFTDGVQVGENMASEADAFANNIGNGVGGASENVAGTLDNGLSSLTNMARGLTNDMDSFEDNLRDNMPSRIDFNDIRRRFGSMNMPDISDMPDMPDMPNMPNMPNMPSPDTYSQEIRQSASDYYKRIRSLIQRLRNDVGV